MGTILAIKKNGKTCIAADSMTISSGYRKQTAEYVVNSEKLFKVGNSYFGVQGGMFPSWSIVFNEYLQSLKTLPSLSTSAEVFRLFLDIHERFKNDFFLNCGTEEEDQFESSGFETLIVTPSSIFKVYDLRSVQEFSKFWAIGQGSGYALGALDALYESNSSAKDIAEKAMNAASNFDDSSSPPFIFYEV